MLCLYLGKLIFVFFFEIIYLIYYYYYYNGRKVGELCVKVKLMVGNRVCWKIFVVYIFLDGIDIFLFKCLS